MADCISKIGISARFLLSLINDILDMSRIESGKMLLKNERFLFRDFISDINTVIYNQTKAKGLDYECVVSSEIAEAYIGDSMKLQQIFVNILANAVKFTKTGKIFFDVRPLSGNGKQSTICFMINDTGVGIPEEMLENIFEPFEQGDSSTTATFGGTGLGLAITKSLVDLMNGSIRVRSIVGVGSEFTVEIPLTIDEETIATPLTDQTFDKSRALIVDDDLIVCEQTCNILRDIGMSRDPTVVFLVRGDHRRQVIERPGAPEENRELLGQGGLPVLASSGNKDFHLIATHPSLEFHPNRYR